MLGSYCKVKGAWSRVHGTGCMVQGALCRVQGEGHTHNIIEEGVLIFSLSTFCNFFMEGDIDRDISLAKSYID